MMAYLDKPHVHQRLASLTGVALIHIALAIGLVAGLTVTAFNEEELVIFEGKNVPLPQPTPTEAPPPTPRDEAKRIIEIPVAPTPDIALHTDGPEITTTILPPVGSALGVRDIILPPLVADPPRAPAFTARGAAPKNGPTGWVTTDDYPLRALRREWEGTVNYALQVGTDGRVDECRILSSSGHDVLDEATCRWVERRARFDAAIDGTGAQIAGSYRGAVTWQIPDN